MLDHYPSIKIVGDVPKKRESPLTLHYKLFGVSHVPDIVGTSRIVPSASLMTKKEMLGALKDT